MGSTWEDFGLAVLLWPTWINQALSRDLAAIKIIFPTLKYVGEIFEKVSESGNHAKFQVLWEGHKIWMWILKSNVKTTWEIVDAFSEYPNFTKNRWEVSRGLSNCPDMVSKNQTGSIVKNKKNIPQH